MKLPKLLLACALAAAGVSAAHADVTVFLTGSTAYRVADVTAIEKLYGTSANYGVVFDKDTGADEAHSTYATFTGPISGLGNVTVKVAWGGSIGGLRIVSDQTKTPVDILLKGFIPDSLTPAVGTNVGVTEATIAAAGWDTTSHCNAAFSDSFAATALVTTNLTGVGTGTNATNGLVGIVPFEWVVNNAATNVVAFSGVSFASGVTTIPYTAASVADPTVAVSKTIAGKGIPAGTTISSIDTTGKTITLSAATNDTSDTGGNVTAGTPTLPIVTNMSALNGRQLLTAGAIYASQLTGNVADNKPVWFVGRNADSGTRISYLAETGRGTTQQPSQITALFTSSTDTAGLPSKQIKGLYRYPGETILGTPYSIGQSGFSGGGAVAGILSAWGSLSNTNSQALSGGVAPALSTTLGLGGIIVSNLGRSDARTATANKLGLNTAQRLTWNGEPDWNGTIDINGMPASYLDTYVQEGRYTNWEFEHLYRNSALTGDAVTYLTSLAGSIIANDPGVDSIPLSSMNVTRTVEGAVVAHK